MEVLERQRIDAVYAGRVDHLHQRIHHHCFRQMRDGRLIVFHVGRERS